MAVPVPPECCRRSAIYRSRMSRWDWFPYVSGGKELARKPRGVQIIVLATLAIFWVVMGVVSNQTWLIGVGAVIGAGLVVRLVQLSGSSRQRN